MESPPDKSVLLIIALIFGPPLFLVFIEWFFKPNWLWICKHLDWHQCPKELGFDGISRNGKCPRCGMSVLQDSQGNWFASTYQDR